MGNIDYDYWEDHDGSYCPVDPEASVDLKLRDGRILSNYIAGEFFWSRLDSLRPSDIIAYREVHK